jgi:uncharacterized protein (TIGR03083 family)
MEHLEHLEVVTAQAGALASAARAVGPDPTVPAVPEWTMAKLVKHTGTTHAWARANVERGGEFVSPADLDLGLPASPGDYPDWLEAGAAAFATVVGAADPDAPTWSWGNDSHVRFWSRRMAHETTIHRWDAESATGAQAPIALDLAVDGIDERLEHLVPSMEFNAAGAGALDGEGESVHLHCTDADGEWFLRFAPDGFTFTREHAKGDVAVRGPASDLLLWLVGRGPLDALEVLGDPGVLDAHAAIRFF